jgi:esterase/lipase superfamily enzyme
LDANGADAFVASSFLYYFGETLQDWTVNREYHKWFSHNLGRDMEMLVFGHAGVPVICFPTSGGTYRELEDRGLVAGVGWKIDNGEIQLFCVDAVDQDGWYNKNIPPGWRIRRQIQFQSYITDEVAQLVRQKNDNPRLVTLGCSFGGYHAVNIALRRPDLFSGFMSMSGAFDMTSFLDGYYDDDVYFNSPTHYMANMHDSWFLDRYRRNTYLLCTGWDDQCLGQNQLLSSLMGRHSVPHRLEIWGTWNSHDWPTWERQMQTYL